MSNVVVKSLGSITTGLYQIEECDSFYTAYSGYKWIVVFYVGLTPPRQLGGFPDGEFAACEKFFNEKVLAGKEVRAHKRISSIITGKLTKGWLPCPHDDVELKADLLQRGYKQVEYTKTYLWFAKEEVSQTTLF